jgi:hypothetical protein
MIAYLAVGVGIGAILALFFQRLVPVAKEAPPGPVYHGISAMSLDMHGRSGIVELDPQYTKLDNQALKRPARGNNWRTLV